MRAFSCSRPPFRRGWGGWFCGVIETAASCMIGLEGTEYGDDAPRNSKIIGTAIASKYTYANRWKCNEDVLRQERNQNIIACPNLRPCLFYPLQANKQGLSPGKFISLTWISIGSCSDKNGSSRQVYIQVRIWLCLSQLTYSGKNVYSRQIRIGELYCVSVFK
jgi:hypothetical protein